MSGCLKENEGLPLQGGDGQTCVWNSLLRLAKGVHGWDGQEEGQGSGPEKAQSGKHVQEGTLSL